MLDMIITPEQHADLPDPVKAEYSERDGSFQLQVDGAFSRIDRDKLQTSLNAERDDHKTTKAKFAGLDGISRENVEKVWDTAAERGIQLEELQGQGGDLEERASRLAESRVLQQVRPLERKLEEVTGQLQEVTTIRDGMVAEQSASALTGNVVNAFVTKTVGGDPVAKSDVEMWAPTVFQRLEDGTVVSKEGLDGIQAGLSPKEVFGDMQKDGVRPHWFKESRGGGARSGGKVDLTDNPFKLTAGKVESLTKCMAVIRDDPAKARKMADAAGATKLFPTTFPTA